MAGVDVKEIEVNLVGSTLTEKGEKKEEHEEKLRICTVSKIFWLFCLPEPYLVKSNEDKIEATLKTARGTENGRVEPANKVHN